MGLSKKIHSNLCSITRIHGGDIIEDRHIPAYLPLREITLKSVDQIFVASEYIKTLCGAGGSTVSIDFLYRKKKDIDVVFSNIRTIPLKNPPPY